MYKQTKQLFFLLELVDEMNVGVLDFESILKWSLFIGDNRSIDFCLREKDKDRELYDWREV